ncbi:keratin, type II cytoskeletal 2 epidermal-like [Mytilus trossulus]|uniref:keratin, type II cytoskeletal 2 epidermal-like n=1 Tax=Mytilus trossulus TaxID=6551 RepID=UPI00300795FE
MLVVTVLLLSIVGNLNGQLSIFGGGFGAYDRLKGSGRGAGGGFGGISGGGSSGSLAGRLGGGSSGGDIGFGRRIAMVGSGLGVGSFADRRSSGIGMSGGNGGLSMMGRAGRWWCTCRSKICRKWELTVDKNCKLPVIPWYWRTCCQWFPWWVTNRNYVGLSGGSSVGGGSFRSPIFNGGSGSSGSNSGFSGFGGGSVGGTGGRASSGSGGGSRNGAGLGSGSSGSVFKVGIGGAKPSY